MTELFIAKFFFFEIPNFARSLLPVVGGILDWHDPRRGSGFGLMTCRATPTKIPSMTRFQIAAKERS